MNYEVGDEVITTLPEGHPLANLRGVVILVGRGGSYVGLRVRLYSPPRSWGWTGGTDGIGLGEDSIKHFSIDGNAEEEL